MGRKKRSNPANGEQGNPQQPKKAKPETGESFLVKKYRAEKSYNAMEAFVKYTKAHRMFDATYIRWGTGITTEKPFVFSTRVGGVDLGWGRGKAREAAMDCACRAAFALVGAHGYKNFTLDDDCLMEAPIDLPPPPPPPPLAPPLPGMPHLAGGVPPLYVPGLPPFAPPPGYPPHFPPPPPPPNGLPLPPLPPGGLLPPPPPPPPAMTDLIPQPKMVTNHAPVASSLSTHHHAAGSTESNGLPPPVTTTTTSFSFKLGGGDSAVLATAAAAGSKRSKLKGGLTLIFDPGEEGPDECCMEENRASLQRYQKMLRLAKTASS